jgi:hypothetical protein
VLYVTDNAQHTVRAIVVASRVVYTLAGMAGAGDSRDGVGAAAEEVRAAWGGAPAAKRPRAAARK